jgi:hypothetical protein
VSEVNSSNFKQTLDTLISLVCCLVTCNSQVKTCGIYMMQRHDIDSCLTFQDDSTNQVFFFFWYSTNQVNIMEMNPYSQHKYDPYSNTSGWRDHPNLRYRNQEGGFAS